MLPRAGYKSLTNGFVSNFLEQRHAGKHMVLLGHKTVTAYLDAADRFCGGPMATTTRECIRPPGCCTGDRVRWNRATGEFGVLSPDNYIRTYMKLDLSQYRRKYPTDARYFREQCNKVTL